MLEYARIRLQPQLKGGIMGCDTYIPILEIICCYKNMYITRFDILNKIQRNHKKPF